MSVLTGTPVVPGVVLAPVVVSDTTSLLDCTDPTSWSQANSTPAALHASSNSRSSSTCARLVNGIPPDDEGVGTESVPTPSRCGVSQAETMSPLVARARSRRAATSCQLTTFHHALT